MDAEQHGDADGSESAEDVHHLCRVGAVQPGGGLVQEHDPRAGEQLCGDGDPAFLAPAEPAGELVSDERVRNLRDAEVLHRLPNHRLESSPLHVARQSKGAVEHQVLPHRRRPGQHVILRHVPAHGAHLRGGHRSAVDPQLAGDLVPDAGPPGEYVNQRGLSRAGRAEDREQVRARVRDVRVVQVGHQVRVVLGLRREPRAPVRLHLGGGEETRDGSGDSGDSAEDPPPSLLRRQVAGDVLPRQHVTRRGLLVVEVPVVERRGLPAPARRAVGTAVAPFGSLGVNLELQQIELRQAREAYAASNRALLVDVVQEPVVLRGPDEHVVHVVHLAGQASAVAAGDGDGTRPRVVVRRVGHVGHDVIVVFPLLELGRQQQALLVLRRAAAASAAAIAVSAALSAAMAPGPPDVAASFDAASAASIATRIARLAASSDAATSSRRFARLPPSFAEVSSLDAGASSSSSEPPRRLRSGSGVASRWRHARSLSSRVTPPSPPPSPPAASASASRNLRSIPIPARATRAWWSRTSNSCAPRSTTPIAFLCAITSGSLSRA
mmetsp:Transcript_4168/g.18721  ORF Transcript_4168/g.18721 Transcript_4168/m.18721 type:complete len:552 (-) Transcript_4168:331-1986(-)